MLSTFSLSGIKVVVFRDDLNHDTLSGNKLHKLAPNIEAAKARSCSTVLSFGGPFSNHLHALAWASQDVGLASVGIVRGELHDSLTPTLIDCQKWGMQLIPMPRNAYRQSQDLLSSFVEPCLASDLDLKLTSLTNQKNTLVIPEGGSNVVAIKSLTNAYQQVFDLVAKQNITHAICATGTGATLARLYKATPGHVEVICMQAVAEQDATLQRIRGWIGNNTPRLTIHECHLGRFGKTTSSLIEFMDSFENQHGIPLDPVYTGKAMYQLVDMIERGYFKENQTILFIHTGGLQGKRSC